MNKKSNGSPKKTSPKDDNEEVFCLVCDESYGSSHSRESWMKCQLSLVSQVVACTEAGVRYVCHNCESKVARALLVGRLSLPIVETEAGDAATDSGGGLRDLRQVDIGEFDRTEVQEGVHGHQPDPGSCHAG